MPRFLKRPVAGQASARTRLVSAGRVPGGLLARPWLEKVAGVDCTRLYYLRSSKVAVSPPMAAMSDDDVTQSLAKREYTQLLRLHEQLLAQFVRARDELLAPGTDGLVKSIKGRTGSSPDLTELKTAVEETIRSLKLSQSTIQTALIDDEDASFEVDGITNLPAYLQRFLAEHAGQPGFSYEVVQDPVRGWMICWKEYTHRGTVRGYGQICERPYAWLDD